VGAEVHDSDDADHAVHQAVQRGPLGAVALVVDRDAIGRPEGLSTDGLHAKLPRL